ncbi:PLC-like phosphodiesterase [Punctularia strigosozonata HHB-11173 SS5]|uniref:PLC-like phosphodiesterase n=1 Tax=Punctularia strigosozonata (strain HHB-11173) TaxID=741275 RepID=UPI0004416453|nr:PLC-like phosphodiesterase [Punctularia strigosozonata HHB-11173 SS5]EIN08032.1 PLC-like phosphodiesterase [Punctularia strigosozonata HHB-11173 SS5]
MAFYGWPLAQCQSLKTPLAVQLRSGIRVLDIRLSLVHDRLIAYHDIYPQKATFQSILADVHDYFSDAASCRETVVMSIKQEDWRTTPARAFSAAVRREIEESEGGLAGWFLDDRIPSLGEIRGKIVMFSRFGGDGAEWEGGLEGLGIHPSNWPDSEKWGFTWNCKNTLVRTHDWYRIPSFLSIPEKVELATRILLPPANEPPTPCLNITYLSASSLPLAMPPTIARGFGWPQWGLGIEGVNARVGRWLLGLLVDQASTFRRGGEGALPLKVEEEQFQDKLHDIRTYVGGGDMQVVEPRVRGWVMMDFYTDPEEAGLVPLLIELNFRGRIPGQEGWPEADSGSWNRV